MTENERPSGLIANEGIELLTYGTPNGFKVSILLEELKESYGRAYTYQSVNIFQGIQKESWFTEVNPNGCIPAIVDHNKGGYAVMEGLAILNYLTRNYDPEHKFHFEDSLEQCTAEQWLSWHHGGLGPMQAQANYYYRFNSERYAFPTQRFVGETERLYGVLDARLSGRVFIAGSGQGKYSIADIAIWPFANAVAVFGLDLKKYPNVLNWWERINKRPAVKKALMVPSGQEWQFGYDKILKLKEEDPVGYEQAQRPFKEALEAARKEFGYVYKSP